MLGVICGVLQMSVTYFVIVSLLILELYNLTITEWLVEVLALYSNINKHFQGAPNTFSCLICFTCFNL